MGERKSNGFKVGDVVHNGWAGPDNCYSIIVGRTSRKTGPYSTGSYYKKRTLFKGQLVKEISLMDIYADEQTKIGHIDYEGYIKQEMERIIATHPKERGL